MKNFDKGLKEEEQNLSSKAQYFIEKRKIVAAKCNKFVMSAEQEK